MKHITLALTTTVLIASLTNAQEFRTEKDLIGEKKIPAKALYGIQTARALENFQISDNKFSDHPNLIKAFAITKLAAARANTDVGKMPPDVLARIQKAYDAIMAGKYHEWFQVDMYQGGAGTSANMNVNEVMANVALLESGGKIGDYHTVEPHDHLNASQSTNDAYPTALKVATILNNKDVITELELLIKSFRTIGNKYIDVVKMGRTELQDAVPMTVGQQFHAYAEALQWELDELRYAETKLYGVNMGATAIGSGITAPKGYAEKCVAHLADLTGKKMHLVSDLFAGTWDLQEYVAYSSQLKSLAIKLNKISSDLRLMASGPRTGLFEINLPALQPGSSIMPGKVNPVMPELMSLICFRVIGNDVTVTLSAENGDLELNAFEPVAAIAIYESQEIFRTGMKAFRTQCIDGITVNEEVLKMHIERSVGIVTALNPIIGYDKATELAKEALATNKGILQIIREKKVLTEEQIKQLLDPASLTGLDKSKYVGK